MQLSEEQIQHLFLFTKKKLVHWYDLQVELVDHLASRIEEEMNADAGLEFETALERVYKEFGIFGFAKIVQEKSAQLQRAAGKMWWQEIRAFFTWPKAILLGLIIASLFQLSRWFDSNILMISFLVVYVLASIASYVYLYRTSRLRRKLLLLQVTPTHVSTVVFIYQSYIIFGNAGFTPFMFCLLASLGILVELASFQLYIKVKAEARRLYPEAFG
jgi:hypothetical protein